MIRFKDILDISKENMTSLVDIGIELAKCLKPPVSLVDFDSVFEESPDFFEKYRETLNERLNDYHDPNLESRLEEERLQKDLQISQEIEEFNVNSSPQPQTKPDVDEDRILVYSDNQVFDIPEVIVFENSDDYAMIGMTRGDSFLSSVLYVLDSNFRLETKNQRKNTLRQNKIDMAVKIGDHFRRLAELKKYKTNRIEIKTKMMDDVDTDVEPSLQLLIARHFNVNVLVLDLDKKTGQFIGDYEETKETALLVYDGVMMAYLPIFSIKTKSTFENSQIVEFESDFVVNYPKKKTKTTKKAVLEEDKQDEQLAEKTKEEVEEIMKDIESSSGSEDEDEVDDSNSETVEFLDPVKQFMMNKKAENDEKDAVKAKIKAHREAVKQQKKEIKEKKKTQSRLAKEGKILTAKHVDKETVTSDQLLPMTRYPLDRLQAIAGQLGVKTKEAKGEKEVKKAKKDLYLEVVSKVKELEGNRQEQ